MEKGKRLMDKIVTVYYGKEESWESKEAAEQFFLRAMMGSDGKLQMGMTFCTDEEF